MLPGEVRLYSVMKGCQSSLLASPIVGIDSQEEGRSGAVCFEVHRWSIRCLPLIPLALD
jgi:hypothetical protein